MNEKIKIWRTPYSDFAAECINDLEGETCKAVEVYTDDKLAEIAANGFNGIWLHAVPHHLVCVSPFPELGKNAAVHQQNINTLIERAGKYQIKVYLYLQMPRAVSLAEKDFWTTHYKCGGGYYVTSEARSLCVSRAPVREWIENASAKIVEAMPELGGLFLITAAELPAHCYSHRQRKNAPYFALECSHCGKREPADIVADIILAMHRGIRRNSPDFRFIVWNWGWDMWGYCAPYHEILDRLPADIILMTAPEMGGRMDLWRHPDTLFDEYSLIYPGVSESCLALCKYAQRRGMSMIAKLQIGTTHELATVPNLPLMGSLFRKAVYLNELGFIGFIGCWNFGNFFSANTAAFIHFLSLLKPRGEFVELAAFADIYFPGCNARKTVEAWEALGNAVLAYPFSKQFIYNSPVNYTLAYHEIYMPGPLTGKTCGASHLDVPRGDDLSRSVTCDIKNGFLPENTFSLDEVIEHTRRLAKLWDYGGAMFADAVASSQAHAAWLELNNILLIGTIWHSLNHTYRIYRLRQDWSLKAATEFAEIVNEELPILEKALIYAAGDTRQGYHPEAHAYLFSPEYIQRKIAALKSLRFEPV